jgi:predicted dehydrogenase
METVNKKLKVGVVGLGKMGLLHASLLSVMPNVQLAALCDKSWLMRKLAKSNSLQKSSYG